MFSSDPACETGDGQDLDFMYDGWEHNYDVVRNLCNQRMFRDPVLPAKNETPNQVTTTSGRVTMHLRWEDF